MEHFHPTPDVEGITKTRALYRDKYRKEITDQEAGEILGSVMRFVYLTSDLDDAVRSE